MGLLVAWLTLMIVPPFSSMSALLRMEPSISMASWNVFACSTASFPAIDSATKIFRLGWVTRSIFFISSIRFALVCILPAVSINTTSMLLALAYFMASNPTAAGSEL